MDKDGNIEWFDKEQLDFISKLRKKQNSEVVQ